ncbi:MAG: phage tail assembly protein [Caldilineaceae bacterium]
MFQTEYEFALPKGYVDSEGTLHRHGIMRLSTAADEILPLKDGRVQSNPAYLVIILLSRVLMRLGTVELITPKVIEGLFTADLNYLQTFYNQINGGDTVTTTVICPHCERQHALPVGDPAGESSATRWNSSTRR